MNSYTHVETIEQLKTSERLNSLSTCNTCSDSNCLKKNDSSFPLCREIPGMRLFQRFVGYFSSAMSPVCMAKLVIKILIAKLQRQLVARRVQLTVSKNFIRMLKISFCFSKVRTYA